MSIPVPDFEEDSALPAEPPAPEPPPVPEPDDWDMNPGDDLVVSLGKAGWSG